MSHEQLIASLEAALENAPGDGPLRLHLAELLLGSGRSQEAIAHLGALLALHPDDDVARAAMARAIGGSDASSPASASAEALHDVPAGKRVGYDWEAAESELGGVVPPMFVNSGGATDERAFDIEASELRLADVGGMQQVKARLEASFLAPLRNPELRRLYGKSLRGGLLLYGPPGCGKTFIAKAVAGELDASFLAVSLSGILDMFIGNSEKNVTELFEQARASAPCVLFLDEVDAIGQKRTLTRNSGIRGAVNQLLTEMDGVSTSNEGVYVLAATNQPWDVDEALRRPGRLDRTVLVLPPDESARVEIFRFHLRDRPVEQIDLLRLARLADGYSGADIAHICDSAAEYALLDSVRTGNVRMIGMRDLEAAANDVRPSIGSWVQSAKNVTMFANQSGDYDELAGFVRRWRRH